MQEQGFVFFQSWFQAIEGLPIKVRGGESAPADTRHMISPHCFYPSSQLTSPWLVGKSDLMGRKM